MYVSLHGQSLHTCLYLSQEFDILNDEEQNDEDAIVETAEDSEDEEEEPQQTLPTTVTRLEQVDSLVMNLDEESDEEEQEQEKETITEQKDESLPDLSNLTPTQWRNLVALVRDTSYPLCVSSSLVLSIISFHHSRYRHRLLAAFADD